MSLSDDRRRWEGVKLFPDTAWRIAARESGIRKAALIQATERAERDGQAMHVYANGTVHYVRPITDQSPLRAVLLWTVQPDGTAEAVPQ